MIQRLTHLNNCLLDVGKALDLVLSRYLHCLIMHMHGLMVVCDLPPINLVWSGLVCELPTYLQLIWSGLVWSGLWITHTPHDYSPHTKAFGN